MASLRRFYLDSTSQRVRTAGANARRGFLLALLTAMGVGVEFSLMSVVVLDLRCPRLAMPVQAASGRLRFGVNPLPKTAPPSLQR